MTNDGEFEECIFARTWQSFSWAPSFSVPPSHPNLRALLEMVGSYLHAKFEPGDGKYWEICIWPPLDLDLYLYHIMHVLYSSQESITSHSEKQKPRKRLQTKFVTLSNQMDHMPTI